MKRNWKLKAKIFQTGKTAGEVARLAGVPQSYLSMAVNGRYVLDDGQKLRIAKVLRADPRELFNCEQRMA